MRVLVLSQYYWPESFRITDVVELLQRTGCHVTVLAGQPNYPQGTVFEGYSAFGFGAQQHEAGYSIYRVPLVPRGQGSAIALVANYLSFVLSASVLGPWLLRKQSFDVILVFGMSPILQAIPAVVLKWIKGAKLVTWVQDLWPESLEATGYVRNRGVLSMVAVVVRWIYRRNDLLLVQSRAFIPPVQTIAGKTPVMYHPNPGELALGKTQAPVHSALVLEPGYNVVFAGNLGTVQALGTVLDAAELLMIHADVRVVLVGSGSRSEWLQQEIARRQLDNVQLAGRFAPEAMPAILAQASALLVSLVKDPIMSQTVPSKVQAYLAAGKPIIASLDGEGAKVVTESGAGIACPAENARALADAVIRMRAAPFEEQEEMSQRGLRYYEKNFEPMLLTTRLVKIFLDLIHVERTTK
jgi:glycosyltransferase involved in cell wall biosynthesis